MVRAHNFVSALRIFFSIFHNERGQEVNGNYIASFSEKILIWANGPFWARKWCILWPLEEYFGNFAQ